MPLPKPVILGSMFVSLGAFDGMLGVAWPTIAQQLDRPIADLGWLLAAYLSASMCGSLSANWVMQRLGLNACLFWASLVTMLAIIGVALAPSWGLLLVTIAIRGLGNGAIHTYLNTYAGKTVSNRQLMAIHTCWGGGAALAAMSMTYLVSQQLAWQINLIWCVVPALIALSSYHQLAVISPRTQQRHRVKLARWDWMAVLATGFYVAIEASVGNWSYSLMTQGWGTSVAFAGAVTSGFWALLSLCRLGFSILPLGASQWLRTMPVVLALSPLLIGLGFWFSWIGAAGVLLAGISASVVFPNLIAQGVANADEHNHGKVTGLMLTSAAAGGTSGPGLMGLVAGAGALIWIPLPMIAIGAGSAYLAWQITKGPGSDER